MLALHLDHSSIVCNLNDVHHHATKHIKLINKKTLLKHLHHFQMKQIVLLSLGNKYSQTINVSIFFFMSVVIGLSDEGFNLNTYTISLHLLFNTNENIICSITQTTVFIKTLNRLSKKPQKYPFHFFQYLQ